MGKDYKLATERSASLPKFRIGQEVQTPIGIGIIVELAIPHNGLYITPEQCQANIWFGTEKGAESTRFVNHVFQLSQIKKIKKYEESICDMSGETC